MVAVLEAAGCERPHLAGHSLGGAVVSAVGAIVPATSIVNVDQTLQLGGLKEMLTEVEVMLRDPTSFPAVIDGLFAQLAGDKIDPLVMASVNDARRPVQEVVLGVWDLMFSMSSDEINDVVDAALAGYALHSTPYLSLFGIDPGPGYDGWLQDRIPGAEVEVWNDSGHYPHLVDPDRFVARIQSFWQTGGQDSAQNLERGVVRPSPSSSSSA